MGALAVVAVDEVIEASLLLQQVAGGGLGGFLLERQMNALMAAVLLWVTRFDALDVDAEA